MSIALSPVPMPRPMMFGLRTLLEREPLFAALGLILLLAMVPTGIAGLLDPRTVGGVNVWVKPLKFEAALGVYLLTLAFFAAWLPQGTLQRRWYVIYAWVVVAAVVLEMIWIGGAAAFGIASHFNASSPFMAAVYPVMGAMAVTLTTATLVYGFQIARSEAPISPALRASVVSGLVLTFVLTVVVAGYMSAGSSHLVGAAPGADVGAMPFFGWAREAGDLRVAHFFATHAMHVLPLAGLASASVFGGRAQAPVHVASLLYAGFVGFLLLQAVRGEPFLPMIG